jgi:hypothetical protein
VKTSHQDTTCRPASLRAVSSAERHNRKMYISPKKLV